MTAPKTAFKPIKSRRTFEEVSHRIKKLIIDKVYRPGDKLPPEAELAQLFGVGRQSVREALRILELSGFINIKKGGGGGATVKDTITNTISSLFLDAFKLKETSIQELTVARVEMEKVVLKYAIANADGEDLRKLHDNMARTAEKIDNNQIVIDENIEFHRLLAQASKNQIFVLVIEALTTPLRHCLSQILPKPSPSPNPHATDPNPTTDTVLNDDQTVQSKNTLVYHQQIVEALSKKDLEHATALLEEHLKEVEDRLTVLISDAKPT